MNWRKFIHIEHSTLYSISTFTFNKQRIPNIHPVTLPPQRVVGYLAELTTWIASVATTRIVLQPAESSIRQFFKEEDSGGFEGCLEANLKLEAGEGNTQITVNKDKHDSSGKNIPATAILIMPPPSTSPIKGLFNISPSKYDPEGLLITPRSSIRDNKRDSNRVENTESVSSVANMPKLYTQSYKLDNTAGLSQVKSSIRSAVELEPESFTQSYLVNDSTEFECSSDFGSLRKAYPGRAINQPQKKAVSDPEVVARLESLDKTADWRAFNGLVEVALVAIKEQDDPAAYLTI